MPDSGRPREVIQFTGRYAWLILIGVTLIEYMIGRYRILAGTAADDALRHRALRVFGCLSLLTGLAWHG